MDARVFSDIFDTGSLQNLANALSAALRICISIRDPEGKRLIEDSVYGSFYSDVLNKSPEGRTLYEEFSASLCCPCESSPRICRCPVTGLTDASISITVDDVSIARVLAQGIRLEGSEPAETEYPDIARRLRTDTETYAATVRSLPLIKTAHFDHILKLLSLLAERLTLLARERLYLKSVISSLENQESLHRREKSVWETLAEKDSMTGLYNRRKFEEVAACYSGQTGRKICMISADANFLKLTNDIFGHEAGDRLLQIIARIMHDLAKSDWLVARCGGDEFRVILPDTTLETALDYCRRVARNCRRDKSLTLPLSVALGAAEWNSESETLEDCFSRADAKMYQNKTALKHELKIPDYIMDRLFDRQILVREVVEAASRIAREFALYLGLTEEQANDIRLAAYYQDIGMAKLPESFVIRGQSRTNEETTQIHMHVTHSYTMARQFDELYRIADIIHGSHEHWDGKGYPGGLVGEQVPLASRIIHLVSYYARRTHPAVTGGYHSEPDTEQRLLEEGGTVYDPNLTRQFLDFLHRESG